MADWRQDLRRWYAQNRRDLPWRRTRDPYAIWVSEIMCQQTQIAAVLPYFERWMARFPTVESLANASVGEVHALWQGLGYYRRADMLHRGAKFVCENGWPCSFLAWRAVPGVGQYTAGAIASISLGEPVPAVDGNVVRVYARLQADQSSFELASKNAERWAHEVMPTQDCGDWNQALMELGALVCRPKAPRCGECPLNRHCRATKLGIQNELPVPKVAPTVRHIEMPVVVPVFGDFVGLTQQRSVRWWRGLWTFPERVSDDFVTQISNLPPVQHNVTNHRITFVPKLAVLAEQAPELSWFSRDQLAEVAIPAAHQKILKLIPAIA